MLTLLSANARKQQMRHLVGFFFTYYITTWSGDKLRNIFLLTWKQQQACYRQASRRLSFSKVAQLQLGCGLFSPSFNAVSLPCWVSSLSNCFCLPHLCMVAHHCQGKRINLAAKKPHSKKKKTHGKISSMPRGHFLFFFSLAVRLFFLPWVFFFLPWG